MKVPTRTTWVASLATAVGSAAAGSLVGWAAMAVATAAGAALAAWHVSRVRRSCKEVEARWASAVVSLARSEGVPPPPRPRELEEAAAVFASLRSEALEARKRAEAAEAEIEALRRGREEAEADRSRRLRELQDRVPGRVGEEFEEAITRAQDGLAAVVADLGARLSESRADAEQMEAAGRAVNEAARQLDQVLAQARAVFDDEDGWRERAILGGEEVARTAADVEVRTREVADNSEQALRVAEDGRQALGSTLEGFDRLRSGIQQAVVTVQQLSKKIQSIGAILTVIEDVTEQTNLLALNAAIIAAQAGEHGRGFAVVADEIRDLAERTAESTKEISGLIEAIQSDSERAVEKIESEAAHVEGGVRQAGQATATLDQALQDLRKTASGVRRVSDAAEDFAARARDVAAMGETAPDLRSVGSLLAKARASQAAEGLAEASERMLHGADEGGVLLSRLQEVVEQLNAAQRLGRDEADALDAWMALAGARDVSGGPAL